MTIATQIKQMYASLKGVESIIKFYKTQQKKGKDEKIFSQSEENIQSIIKELELRIKELEFKEPQYKG